MVPAVLAAGGNAVALATRLGIASKVGSIMNFAKANPSTFLLAVKETYDQGVSLYDLMTASDLEAMASLEKAAADQIRKMAILRKVDSVNPDTLGDLGILEDEMATIDAAIGVVGSFENLQTIRRVLTMGDEHFEMYLRLRRLSKRIR